MDISLPDSGLVSFGEDTAAIGKANPFVVSLGDGGIATLSFTVPIANGSGYDFAVFENAFLDDFLELAFVEVSSDGENFFRFDAVSLTQTDVQVESFGLLEATQIHNLAGKYRFSFGVPFDLEELTGIEGLDVNNIISVRIIDVVGSIDEAYSSFDVMGSKINDPWPTPFPSGGFDLDAVGVIHNQDNTSVDEEFKDFLLTVYPNPATEKITVQSEVFLEKIVLMNSRGSVLLKEENLGFYQNLNISSLPQGLLIIQCHTQKGIVSVKAIKK